MIGEEEVVLADDNGQVMSSSSRASTTATRCSPWECTGERDGCRHSDLLFFAVKIHLSIFIRMIPAHFI